MHFSARLVRVLSVLLLTLPAGAQIAYEVEIDTLESAWRVEGTISNPDKTDFEFWIARWTPGAYHPADYGRFVRDFEAFDSQGKMLEVVRESDSTFRIPAAGLDSVRIRYTADSLSEASGGMPFSNSVIDVEANRVTEDYAFLNPVSLLGFVDGRLDDPYQVSFALPREWNSACALERDEQGAYHASSFYRLEDSPFFFSPEMVTKSFYLDDLVVDVSVHGKTEQEIEEIVTGCERVVRATGELFGGFPFERYHFLLGFTPGSGGSGLEHMFSTLILMTPTVGTDSVQLWGIVAHELVHAWSAERIHVESVHDPDYTEVLETGTIWFNEGVTEYISQHVLVQAGYLDEAGFLEELAGPLPFPEEALGQFLGGDSWTEISRKTAAWESGQDLMAFALRSYILGRRTIFALDLEMRRASKGERGIIDLLRFLMDEYVAKDRGFREGTLMNHIEEIAGEDLDWFYEQFIDGPELPDLGASLDVIGYRADEQGAHEVESPSEKQLAARADLFSIP